MKQNIVIHFNEFHSLFSSNLSFFLFKKLKLADEKPLIEKADRERNTLIT